jgi:hypothetical protein
MIPISCHVHRPMETQMSNVFCFFAAEDRGLVESIVDLIEVNDRQCFACMRDSVAGLSYLKTLADAVLFALLVSHASLKSRQVTRRSVRFYIYRANPLWKQKAQPARCNTTLWID